MSPKKQCERLRQRQFADYYRQLAQDRYGFIHYRFGRDRLSTNVRFASIPTINSGLWDLSRLAEKPTYAVQQATSLFDHLVGAGAERGREFEAERLSSL